MEVVSGLTLEVSSGEIVALIGRNGAGKTTTLLSIAGLRYGRFAGSVQLDGTDLSRASAKQVVDAGIAHVPDGHRIFRSLTVAENLRLGAYSQRRHGRQAIEQTLARVYELFPVLKHYAGRNAGFLSGGEQQMTAIGQALMARPRILMLDEPTSGLALPVIKHIVTAFESLRDDGIGILIVEQSVPRALAVSSRCYVMERGRVVLSGASIEMAADQRVAAIVRGTAQVSEGIATPIPGDRRA
jgi:branched-chain amino acid transport system ATP-binding protein